MSKEVFDPAQFSYTSDSRGYMIAYRGRNIGGVATASSGGYRHWRNKQKDTMMFAEQARNEVEKLKAGCGQTRFWVQIHMIERDFADTRKRKRLSAVKEA